MEHPPLTDVLASVLSAAVENPHRPALLARLRSTNDGRPSAGNVIPLPRQSVESQNETSNTTSTETHDPEPTPAA